MEVPLLGRHNAVNALAGATAALVVGIPPTIIPVALARMKPIRDRMQLRRGMNGLRIIDDSYNANPSSFAAALEVLAEADGEKVLVMRDMAELRESAASWHVLAGEDARTAGLDALYAIGNLSRYAVESFGPGGHHLTTHRELIASLRGFQRQGVTILIQMEQVVTALLKRATAANGRRQA